MIGLFFIQVTANGKSIPVRIDDIDRVYPVTGSVGGSRILLKKGGEPIEVNETPAQVYTAINAQCTAYLTALGNP